MQYTIKGGNFPVVSCMLTTGEAMICESGAMTWMDPSIKMETKSGGIGKVFGRMLSGENLFQNRFVAESDGEIAFGTSFPGEIRAIELTGGRSIIAQKASFLASTEGVAMDVFFQKKIGAGIFGGEGFIMQKIHGDGIVFIEIGGGAVEFELAAGQQKIIDTGYLVMMDETCSMDIVSVSGVKNALFGGEGLFNTVITGPGKIIVQTLPESTLIAKIASAVGSKNN